MFKQLLNSIWRWRAEGILVTALIIVLIAGFVAFTDIQANNNRLYDITLHPVSTVSSTYHGVRIEYFDSGGVAFFTATGQRVVYNGNYIVKARH